MSTIFRSRRPTLPLSISVKISSYRLRFITLNMFRSASMTRLNRPRVFGGAPVLRLRQSLNISATASSATMFGSVYASNPGFEGSYTFLAKSKYVYCLPGTFAVETEFSSTDLSTGRMRPRSNREWMDSWLRTSTTLSTICSTVNEGS